jgi:hypothetical protein
MIKNTGNNQRKIDIYYLVWKKLKNKEIEKIKEVENI